MPLYEVQMAQEAASNIPADIVINTLHVKTFSTPSEADFQEYGDKLHGFFHNTPSDAAQVGLRSLRSSRALTGSARYKWYQKSDPKPQVPHADVFRATGQMASGVAHPAEVALCISYAATPESGIDQGRRRGRIYLGGLAASTLGADGYVLQSAMEQATAAFFALDNALRASANSAWLMGWSPKDRQEWAITRCWVDNAFDTQRRRGPDPTNRVTLYKA